MSPYGYYRGPCYDYGPATWTDLMQIREYRERIVDSKRHLSVLSMSGANPIDVIQERITLQGAQWRLHQLESRFELKSDDF